MGVVHRGSPAAAAAGRTELFVLRILERYASGCAGVAPVETILRARPDPAVANVFHMASVLSLRLRSLHEAPAVERVTGSPPPPHARSSGRPVPSGPPRPAFQPSRALFERIFARENRIETIVEREPTPGTSSASSAEQRRAPPGSFASPSWSPPIPMVLRRDGAPREQPAAPQAPRDISSALARGSAGAGEARVRPIGPPQGALAFSASDLGRLTDEVVRAIDDRIVAQRERKGLA